MNMNSSMQYGSRDKTTAIETKKGGWAYAFSQYITMLKRWGGKFMYLIQWSLFNFGFHVIISCGKINYKYSYNNLISHYLL